MNAVNDMIEKGFVQTMKNRMISLHPMIQEAALDETKPSVRNCCTLLNSLQEICLQHGKEVSYYKQMFRTMFRLRLISIPLLAECIKWPKNWNRQRRIWNRLHILKQYKLTAYHNSIAQIINYAVLLTDMGQPDSGLSDLKTLSRVIRECNSDKSMHYTWIF